MDGAEARAAGEAADARADADDAAERWAEARSARRAAQREWARCTVVAAAVRSAVRDSRTHAASVMHRARLEDRSQSFEQFEQGADAGLERRQRDAAAELRLAVKRRASTEREERGAAAAAATLGSAAELARQRADAVAAWAARALRIVGRLADAARAHAQRKPPRRTGMAAAEAREQTAQPPVTGRGSPAPARRLVLGAMLRARSLRDRPRAGDVVARRSHCPVRFTDGGAAVLRRLGIILCGAGRATDPAQVPLLEPDLLGGAAVPGALPVVAWPSWAAEPGDRLRGSAGPYPVAAELAGYGDTAACGRACVWREAGGSTPHVAVELELAGRAVRGRWPADAAGSADTVLSRLCVSEGSRQPGEGAARGRVIVGSRCPAVPPLAGEPSDATGADSVPVLLLIVEGV